jgi:hypothetical protein
MNNFHELKYKQQDLINTIDQNELNEIKIQFENSLKVIFYFIIFGD